MSAESASRWNERYRRGEHPRQEPHPLVVEFASQFVPGRALDLACGAGRHAVWLAERGWQVTAVDGASAAIELLQQYAVDRGVVVDSHIADLERGEFIIEPDSCDLIVVCNYLQQDLFPSIREGTRRGGVVIAIIAMIDSDPDIKPMNPAFLLKPGELRAEFKDWELIWDFEGKPRGGHDGRAVAELVARKCRSGFL